MAMDAVARRALLDGLAEGEKESKLARKFGISRERVRQYKVGSLAHLQPLWEKRQEANLQLLHPFMELVGTNRRCRMCGCDLSNQPRPAVHCPACKSRREAIRYFISRLRTFLSTRKELLARRALNMAAYLARKHALTLNEVELYLRGRN